MNSSFTHTRTLRKNARAPDSQLARTLWWQDARWRRGETVSLKAARDSMVSLELASHAQMVYQKR